MSLQFAARGLWRLAQPLLRPAQLNRAAPRRGAAALGAAQAGEPGKDRKLGGKTSKKPKKTGKIWGKFGEQWEHWEKSWVYNQNTGEFTSEILDLG